MTDLLGYLFLCISIFYYLFARAYLYRCLSTLQLTMIIINMIDRIWDSFKILCPNDWYKMIN